MLRRLLVTAMLAGCYAPPDAACGITCDTDCPGDLTCIDHRCVRGDGEQCEPAIGFTALSVGGRHACGLDAEGALFCWGDNRVHQLGTTDERLSARPSRVAGTWSMVAAGGTHTCALRDGAAYCWGENTEGQVTGKDGPALAVPTKVDFGIATPPVFTKIVAGGANSCALGAGQLYCWGDERFLGTGTSPNIAVPIAGTDWSDVALGADFGCGVKPSGIECWGSNDDGQIGLPASATVPTPRAITGLPTGNVTSIETGADDVCVVIDGELWCWGDGKIMGGGANTPTAPMRLGTDTAWTKVAIADTKMCGLLRGGAHCWGQTSGGGLGSGLWEEDRSQAEASDLGPADDIDFSMRTPMDVSDRFGCLRAGAEVRCWGDNSFGQLGIGIESLFPTPQEVLAPAGRLWTSIRSGWGHSCATLDDHSIQCWGINEHGTVDPANARGREQACTPQSCDFARPVPGPVAGVKSITAGADFSCAHAGDTINCWGDNREARLGASTMMGHGPTTLVPPAGTLFTALLTGGTEASCAHLDTNRIACWGNIAGTQRTEPTIEPSNELFDINQVGIGDHAVCALRNDDYRVCWGANDVGQMGNGGTSPIPAPLSINSPLLIAISSRYQHSCGVAEGGEVLCWGRNDYDQNGVDTMTTVATPVKVNGVDGELDSCTAVAVAERHSCAVCANRVLCWGENGLGELGRGTTGPSSKLATPIALDADLKFFTVSAIESGGCALTEPGRLFCWGDSWRGQVGSGGSAKNLPTPVAGAL